MPYFKDFKDDGNFEECILYLGLTPILYFTILIFLEEKLLPLLLMKAKKPQLRVGCETMDDLVKKEKHVVALEINKVNNKSKMYLEYLLDNNVPRCERFKCVKCVFTYRHKHPTTRS